MVATAVMASAFWWLSSFPAVVGLEAESVAIRYGRDLRPAGSLHPDDRGAGKLDPGALSPGGRGVSVPGGTGCLVGGPAARRGATPKAVLVFTDPPHRLVEVQQRIVGHREDDAPQLWFSDPV